MRNPEPPEPAAYPKAPAGSPAWLLPGPSKVEGSGGKESKPSGFLTGFDIHNHLHFVDRNIRSGSPENGNAADRKHVEVGKVLVQQIGDPVLDGTGRALEKSFCNASKRLPVCFGERAARGSCSVSSAGNGCSHFCAAIRFSIIAAPRSFALQVSRASGLAAAASGQTYW